MLLPTILFFMIVIIVYLLKPDNVTVKAEPEKPETETETEKPSFKLDYPPKNIGCAYETKPLSAVNNRMLECQKN